MKNTNLLSRDYILHFEETVTKYLLFLAHVQQSINLSAKSKIEVFEFAKMVSNSIYSNVKSYISGKNEFNIYDKNHTIIKSFNDIIQEIDKEFKAYKRDITITDSFFSYHKILETLIATSNTIYLTKNDIQHILSFKELYDDAEKEKLNKKQMEDLEKKQNEDFNELRQKTFVNKLHGNMNKNPILFFELTDYILNNFCKDEIKYIHNPSNIGKHGVYFTETQKERRITCISENRLIELYIQVVDLDNFFLMYIQGSIKVNKSKEEFYINEKYLNKQSGEIVNAYNLKNILYLFNELKIYEIMADKEDTKTSTSDIKNLFSGKIKW
ncbi:MAG: hypothetical protein Ta2F_18280 [Termitinemataceae bacterium]|nr:MAG: hypothetical protein Ta2F_18280 [Termitinemataceae bacterium]